MKERDIFLEALELHTLEARTAYLRAACGEDVALRGQVEELLREHFSDDPLLAGPAIENDPARSTAPEPAPPGGASQRIGPYKLLEKIGEGGFGEVWMAEQQEPVRRRVALKIIKPGMDSRQIVGRFEAERQALALMDHPNIARLFDAGTTESGRPFFVMELVHGVKITEFCEQNQLTTRQRLELFVVVCQAIQHAHQKGIIHRDIKPSNILVTLHDGAPAPKVIDFGIAKATQQSLTEETVFTQFQQFLGTPAYISPEQAEMSGLDIDTRADIYSLGVLVYELLTGQTPFDTRELLAAGLEHMRRTIREKAPLRPSTALARQRITQGSTVPRPSSIDRDLDWIAMKCLEKDRTRRYATANGVAMDVQRHLANEPVLARPPSNLYQFQRLMRRHKLAFAAAAVIALALTSLLILALRYAEREHQNSLRLQSDLARQHLHRGQTLCLKGDVGRGLHWMVRALEEAPQGSAALISTIRQNLGSWSRRAEPPLAVLPHHGTARLAAYSPDGSRLLTGSEDGTAKLWHADTGQLIGHPMRHEGPLLVATFSPDAHSVLTASRDKSARLWSAHDGAPLGPLFRHEAEPTTAIFRPDGACVFTASQDGAARLWSARTGQPLSPWLRHGARIRAAAFNPSGSLVVTAGGDGTVRFWSGDEGEPRGEPLRLGQGVNAVTFSPGGEEVLTGSDDQTARLWSVPTRRPIGPPLRHRGRVNTVAFSPDGLRVVTGGADGVARLWSVTTGEPIGFEMQHRADVLVAKFTPDAQRVVTGSENNSAMLWSAATGEPLAAPIPHDGWVWSLAFSPDGRRMLTGADDHSAKLWSIAPSSKGGQVLTHGSVAWSATFSPDGTRVLVGGQSNEGGHGSVRLWSVATGQPGPILPHPGLVWIVAFSPDGHWILTGGRDGVARLWSAQTLEPSPIQFRHPFDVRCAAFSKDGKFVATGGFDRSARVWHRASGQAAFPPFPHGQYVEDLAFNPAGTLLATGCGDGAARLWSLQTGQQTGPALRHSGSVLAVAFSPDGNRLLTGSTDLSARFWDVRTGAPVGPVLEHQAWAEAVAFSPDGRRVATGDAFDSAWLWSAATGELLAPPFKHAGPVNEVAFSPDGRQLLTASHDTTARIWDIPASFNGPIHETRPWIESLTGKAMDERGVLSWLDAETWGQRRKQIRLAP